MNTLLQQMRGNYSRISILEGPVRDRLKKDNLDHIPQSSLQATDIEMIIKHQSEQEQRTIRRRNKRDQKQDESKKGTKSKDSMKENAQNEGKQLLFYFKNQLSELNPLLLKKRTVLEFEKKGNKLKEFLSTNEILEIKRFYSDYNLGDAMLVFDNPDEVKSQKGISLKEALIIFDKCLSVVTSDPGSKTRIQIEKEAFLRSFLSLEDLKEVDEVTQEEKVKWWQKLSGRKNTAGKEYLGMKGSTEGLLSSNTGPARRVSITVF